MQRFSFPDGPIPLGKLHINKLSQLTRLGGSIAPSHVNPTLADLDGDSDTEDPVSGEMGQEK